MKITILTENLAGGTYLAEHGLSYLIEIDGESILFDTGHSDVFLQNANKLGVDIQNTVTQVVLSHGHWDHGNGLKHLSNKTLIAHPGVFVSRFRKSDHGPVGLAITKHEIEKQFHLIETAKPYQLAKNVFYLGEIPRLNDFESQTTPFEFANGDNDFVNDDSALVVIQNNELIVITACSHSGICNICEYAKMLTGKDTIRVIIGGFHLKFQNNQTEQTIAYFKKNKVETILPSHCTDLPALALFYQQFKIQQVKTGMTFEF
jgi:7,8-dihydropterin-6-yl-methyl-4-(beta-D-ribofuranosyl)aminobenzene 5'-phosphate synthase